MVPIMKIRVLFGGYVTVVGMVLGQHPWKPIESKQASR